MKKNGVLLLMMIMMLFVLGVRCNQTQNHSEIRKKDNSEGREQKKINFTITLENNEYASLAEIKIRCRFRNISDKKQTILVFIDPKYGNLSFTDGFLFDSEDKQVDKLVSALMFSPDEPGNPVSPKNYITLEPDKEYELLVPLNRYVFSKNGHPIDTYKEAGDYHFYFIYDLPPQSGWVDAKTVFTGKLKSNEIKFSLK